MASLMKIIALGSALAWGAGVGMLSQSGDNLIRKAEYRADRQEAITRGWNTSLIESKITRFQRYAESDAKYAAFLAGVAAIGMMIVPARVLNEERFINAL